MSRMRRPRAISIHPLILLALLAAAPGVVFAQGGSVGIPENASVKSYGSGWECDRGHQEVDGACAAVKVPPKAYLNSFGDEWKCDRGYRKVNEACLAVKVPANGYLADSSYGLGWTCDRGYRAVKEACVAVKVPANAHLDYSGNDWECNGPYRKQQDWCALP